MDFTANSSVPDENMVFELICGGNILLVYFCLSPRLEVS